MNIFKGLQRCGLVPENGISNSYIYGQFNVPFFFFLRVDHREVTKYIYLTCVLHNFTKKTTQLMIASTVKRVGFSIPPK